MPPKKANSRLGKKLIKSTKVNSKKRVKKCLFSTCIFRVLKEVQPNNGISALAMSIMNSLVCDIFDLIATEAGKLATRHKRSTITSREIQTAARLLLPGELARHAVSEGCQRLSTYKFMVELENPLRHGTMGTWPPPGMV